MYTKQSQQSPEITRWSDSLKKLTQRNAKRISPYTAIEKKVMILSPKKTKGSHLKAAFFQKAIMNHATTQEQSHTPELCSSPSSSSSSSSSSSLSLSEKDSAEIDGVIQRLLDDEHSIKTDTDEEDYDDDIVEQALSRILSSKQGQKSLTCPNIVALDRPLPPLPNDPVEKLTKSVEQFRSSSTLYASTSKITRAAATKGQVQLKRAATWLGLPVQRLLASPQVQNLGLLMSRKYNSSGNVLISRHNLPVLSISNSTLSTKDSIQEDTKEFIYGTDSDHFAFLKTQLEKKSPAVTKKEIINKKTFVTPKRIMYCRVMQIINLASTRDCDYELHVQLNNATLATKKGVLRKVGNNISADRPQEEALVFEVEEPFSLNFIVAARHTNTMLREGLAKMGIWPLQTVAKPAPPQELPVAGFTCLNFENKMDVLDQGVSRFRLTKPIDKSANRWLNIELLIDIKVEEVLPAVVHRFPWSNSTHPSSYQQNDDDDIMSDPKELAISLDHCRQGDFLTLYTRGMAHPTWKRYWVTMEDNHLVLHDFTYKETKEPISIIPLIPLQAVSKPSMDDCDNVGIARKTGIMLQFDRNTAMLTEPVRLDSHEGLEGKAYLFGDSERKTIHWRRALSAYITDEDNKNKTTKDGVDLRFLW